MNQMPSLPGSGWYWPTVAPVPAHTVIAGCVRTVDATGENVKLVVPLTLNWRLETLLYMLHASG
jgi:hypothetical protein